MKVFRLLAITLLAAIAATSCDDGSSTIGSSIVDDKVTIVIDSAYTVEGHSTRIESVQSRTLSQLLGRVDIDGFGRLSSTIVTQFLPAAELDTTGMTADDIDSLKLCMLVQKGDFVGDSITPMGLDIHPLTKLLPSPIFSNFDPQTYYSNQVIGDKIYNLSAVSQTDSVAALKYNYLRVDLPVALARDLYNSYLQAPATFANPGKFCADVFKGIYIGNTYGSGRMFSISQTTLEMYYHYTTHDSEKDKDTTIYTSKTYFATTPEVVTNNNFTMQIDPKVENLVAQGQQIVMSPAGYEVEFTFPARQIIANYRANTTNRKLVGSLTFSVPVDTVATSASLAPPEYLLMILKSEKDKFFSSYKMTDNVTSFYATYDAATHSYTFPSMRDYILKLLDQETVSDDDVTMVLAPINVTFETSSSSSYYSYYYGTQQKTPTSIIPYVLPSIGRLRLDKARIIFNYSMQQ